MSCTAFFALCVVVVGICAIIRGARETHLLEKNPEAWKALKDEEAKQRERKRRKAGGAAITGARIAARLLKRR